MPLGQKRRQRLSKTDLLMGQSFQIGIGSKWSDSRIVSLVLCMLCYAACTGYTIFDYSVEFLALVVLSSILHAVVVGAVAGL